MKKIAKLYIILCWSFFVFVLMTAFIPSTSGAVSFLFWDKLVHFFLFGGLALIFMFVFAYKQNEGILALTAVLISSIYALALEWVQSILSYRSFSYADIGAGVAGGVVFALGYYIYLHRARSRKKRLLLHICCAGCAAYIPQLLRDKYELTLFFYNPNIYPYQEYKKRVREAKKIASLYELDLVIGKYDHANWLYSIAGHQNDPEGGERCFICYEERLEAAAKAAKKKKLDIFTTTLTISPHKKADKINEIGRNIAREYKIDFLEQDFKKQDGFKRSCQLSRQLDLYRQNYCGCEFSR